MLDLLSQPINFFSDLKDDPSIFIGEVWLRLVCLSFGSAGRFLSLFFDLVRLKPWMVNPLRPVFLLLVVACGGLVEWWIFCLRCFFFGGPFGCCFGILMDYGEVSASGFLLFLCERVGACGIPMGAGFVWVAGRLGDSRLLFRSLVLRLATAEWLFLGAGLAVLAPGPSASGCQLLGCRCRIGCRSSLAAEIANVFGRLFTRFHCLTVSLPLQSPPCGLCGW